MMNTAGHRYIPRVALIAAAALLCQEALACSGMGVSVIMDRNTAIGFAAFAASALFAVPLMVMRFARRGLTVRAHWPLLLLVLHPAWTIGAYGGDCGYTRRDASAVFGVLLALVMIREAIMLAVKGRASGALPLKWSALVSLLLVASAATVWAAPWTLNPLPVQKHFVVEAAEGRLERAQTEYFKENGVYARSGVDLMRPSRWMALNFEKHLDNDDGLQQMHGRQHHVCRMLQGPASDPRGWHVEGGLSDWAVTLRPEGFPERGTWLQFLVLSDGRVYSKADPGDGSFLIDGVPDDPEADGWSLDSLGYRSND